MNSTWNTTLYDTKHQFVSKYGEGLISFLNPKAGEQILDVGCGTGDLAAQITETGAKVIGIDQSASMNKQAKNSSIFPSTSKMHNTLVIQTSFIPFFLTLRYIG
ncbi:class I SAM-dependent methyltransferase [Viridibacillus sp. NPDC096237]|uniref:class I SAM-dependent methyltransferase n=1 Tax=Viridibacillus sp. NPDC096237 TaxID=3390721 RepID=UPI003CFEC597